ncbi:MAG: TetR/AcrR family transcriptional regulator [Maricaulaceae bacterium]
MAKTSHPPQAALDAVTGVFRDHGYEGASLARLSEATGLGRSSLYHYFPNGKADMARAAVEHVGDVVGRTVITPLEQGGPVGPRLDTALAALNTFYGDGTKACLGDVFGLCDAEDAVPDGAGSLLRALMAGFVKLARDAGAPADQAPALAEQVLSDLEGGLVLARAWGDTGPFQRALARTRTVLIPNP